MPELNVDKLRILKEDVAVTVGGKRHVVRNFSGDVIEAAVKAAEADGDGSMERGLAIQLSVFTGSPVEEFMGLGDVRMLVIAVEFIVKQIGQASEAAGLSKKRLR